MTEPLVAYLSRAVFYAATGLFVACLLVLLCGLIIVSRRAAIARGRAAASAAVRPGLQDALVEFVAGSPDDAKLRAAMASHPEDVEASILLFQGAVGGSARDRLCRLTLDLGIVHRWCQECHSRDVLKRRMAVSRLGYACVYEPCRRVAGELLSEALEDADEEVRLSASRGLALFGGTAELKHLFNLAVGPNLLIRTVLTEALRPHATTLVGAPMREVLRSGKADRTAAALEILAAWERAVPMENLGELMEHHDRKVRVLAFRLAAFLPVDLESRRTVVRGLQNSDREIRALAIIAMGRQKMKEWLPELAASLRREDLELARHAAHALAAMPPEGWLTLEELSESPNEATALASSEALARLRTGA